MWYKNCVKRAVRKAGGYEVQNVLAEVPSDSNFEWSTRPIKPVNFSHQQSRIPHGRIQNE